MEPIDVASARAFLEAIIAGFSVLGGGMAYFSGFNAAEAVGQELPPETVAHRINEGIGRGFEIFVPVSVAAFAVMMASS